VNPRAALRAIRSSGWWKPGVAAYLIRDSTARRVGTALPTDYESLRAAADWLARAQDASPDGGIAGRFTLAGGWSSSYPETTGYAIPTLLKLAAVLNDDSFHTRAARCVDFLLSVQLPEGGFPGLEIADNRTKPSPFNTAQILHGLQSWHRATGEQRMLDPIRRAAEWMCDVQDPDGCWRKHWYRELACAYSAHAACWLADAADLLGESRYLAAAEKNLHWVLAQHDSRTGWFDRSGFSEEDHRRRRAYTHTIAYTLDGVLRLATRFGVETGLSAVTQAADGLLLRMERSRTLAAILDHEWRPQCSYVCLTGNAQVASIWLQLARTHRDLRYANAAFKALDEVKRAQRLEHSNPGIRGGIPGSSPIGGAYIQYAIPNWAAKFFADALCAKRECLERWWPEAAQAALSPAVSLPLRTAGTMTSAPSVVVYTTRISPTFAALAERWRRRRFSPTLVVSETGAASMARRWASAARRRSDDTARLCAQFGWQHRAVPHINHRDALAAIAKAKPDLAVAAGAGILRRAALAAPRLGTLNAHMGLLPAYRGMNVAEWSALNGDAIGCSVLLLDEGIDTGPVVATRIVPAADCRTIAELRARIETAQLDLLDDVISAIVDERRIPAPQPQAAADGRQYFRLHEDLKTAVNQRLNHAATA